MPTDIVTDEGRLRTRKYCNGWNEKNDYIEQILLTKPFSDAVEIIIPEINKWKKKLISNFKNNRMSGDHQASFDDIFSDTVLYMYIKGFEDFKKKKRDGVDVHLYPFFLTHFQRLYTEQIRKLKGFKSDNDYNIYLKIRNICKDYDVTASIENAYLFSMMTNVSFACIVRTLECYKKTYSYEEMCENKQNW